MALDASQWTDANLQPPIDKHVIANFLYITYHEAAHLVYAPFFAAWCASSSTSCNNFASCIEGLTDAEGNSKNYDKDSNNPCAEAYANDSTSQNLCINKMQVCQNGDLTQEQKDAMIAELDAGIAAANSRCAEQSADCVNCGGPPMPSGFNNCNPTSCDCPE